MVTIRRDAAIGDILMVTPIIQALRYKYGRVGLRVAPSLHDKIKGLLGGKAVELVRDSTYPVIDLNGAYETRPHLHPVEAYTTAAGVELSDTTRPFCSARHDGVKFDVVIHATVSWPNRTLPRSFWGELVRSLKAEGLSVACVAQNQAEIAEGCDAVFLGKPLPEVAGLIGYGAKVFIGGDSAPLHLAACTSTPIIGLFTIARAQLRRPWRPDSIPFVGIDAAVDCVGCLHRAPQPCSFYECDHVKTSAHFQSCLNAFSIPDIVAKALTLCKTDGG